MAVATETQRGRHSTGANLLWLCRARHCCVGCSDLAMVGCFVHVAATKQERQPNQASSLSQTAESQPPSPSSLWTSLVS
ncbi:hypothetical protein KCU99_g14, partial [Aureobasidium melanogenum]